MRDCNERERSTDIVSRTMRKTATRSWGIGFMAKIASLMPRYSGLGQLGGLGMRAVAERYGRGRVSHGLGLRRPAFWLAAGLIFAANCIATKSAETRILACRQTATRMIFHASKREISAANKGCLTTTQKTASRFITPVCLDDEDSAKSF